MSEEITGISQFQLLQVQVAGQVLAKGNTASQSVKAAANAKLLWFLSLRMIQEAAPKLIKPDVV